MISELLFSTLSLYIVCVGGCAWTFISRKRGTKKRIKKNLSTNLIIDIDYKKIGWGQNHKTYLKPSEK
jgi:hypothetical protein